MTFSFFGQSLTSVCGDWILRSYDLRTKNTKRYEGYESSYKGKHWAYILSMGDANFWTDIFFIVSIEISQHSFGHFCYLIRNTEEKKN